MIRVLLLLECDTCDAFWPTTVKPHPQLGFDTQDDIHNFEYEAEEGGWNIYKNQHICAYCMVNATTTTVPG